MNLSRPGMCVIGWYTIVVKSAEQVRGKCILGFTHLSVNNMEFICLPGHVACMYMYMEIHTCACINHNTLLLVSHQSALKIMCKMWTGGSLSLVITKR